MAKEFKVGEFGYLCNCSKEENHGKLVQVTLPLADRYVCPPGGNHFRDGSRYMCYGVEDEFGTVFAPTPKQLRRTKPKCLH